MQPVRPVKKQQYIVLIRTQPKTTLNRLQTNWCFELKIEFENLLIGNHLILGLVEVCRGSRQEEGHVHNSRVEPWRSIIKSSKLSKSSKSKSSKSREEEPYVHPLCHQHLQDHQNYQSFETIKTTNSWHLSLWLRSPLTASRAKMPPDILQWRLIFEISVRRSNPREVGAPQHKVWIFLRKLAPAVLCSAQHICQPAIYW